MIETSWSNSYKIGYNNDWFSFRQTQFDRLDIMSDGCGRVPMSFAQEAVNTASILESKYGIDNICLFYSGGGDSEIILQSFIGCGKIPSKIIFLDYGSNSYDKYFATEFTKYYGISLEIMQLDAVNLLHSGESFELCKKYQCGQIGLSFYLKAIDFLCKDYYVITGDEPYIEKMFNPITSESEWQFFAREAFYSLWKVFIYNNVDGCPNFIQYSPELFTSFLDDSVMKWLRGSQTSYTTSNQVKASIYRRNFFLRPREKSTGMEAFGPLIHEKNQELFQKYPELTQQELKVPFDQLYHQLTRFI